METVEEAANNIKTSIINYLTETTDERIRPSAAHVAAILVGNDEWFGGLALRLNTDLNYTNLKENYTELEGRLRPELEEKVKELEARVDELTTLADSLAEDNANLRNTVAGFQAKRAE